ncbi:MAG: hypothetical protein C4297_03350 [Gemmataceae bacterium]
MYPHRIQLAGPWDYEILEAIEPSAESVAAGSGPDPPERAGRITVPVPLRLATAYGVRRIRLRRYFHWLARLADHETVWLVLGAINGSARCYLNDVPLGTGADPFDGIAFDITQQLRRRNELVVDLFVVPDQDRPWLRRNVDPGNYWLAPVWLEVTGSARLDKVGIVFVAPDQGLVKVIAVLRAREPGAGWMSVSMDDRYLAHWDISWDAGVTQRATEIVLGQEQMASCQWSPDRPRTPRWQVDCQGHHLTHFTWSGLAAYWPWVACGAGRWAAGDDRHWPVHDRWLTVPVCDQDWLERADLTGQCLQISLPLVCTGIQGTSAGNQDSAARILENIAVSLSRHPCIVGWKLACEEEHGWDPGCRLRQTLHLVDPLRAQVVPRRP